MTPTRTIQLAVLLLWAASLPASAETRAERLRLQRAVDNVQTCYHFGGEINGDGSQHDREVFHQQKRYCHRAEHRWLVKAYRKNPQDARLYPAVLLLNEMIGLQLPKEEMARMCAVARTTFACP